MLKIFCYSYIKFEKNENSLLQFLIIIRFRLGSY